MPAMLRGEMNPSGLQTEALKSELIALRNAAGKRSVEDPRINQRIVEIQSELSKKMRGTDMPTPVRQEEPQQMKKGGSVTKKDKWIQKAIKKPGALKKSLGVKKNEKIPAKKLEKATKAPGKLGQRARLAKTLKKLGK